MDTPTTPSQPSTPVTPVAPVAPVTVPAPQSEKPTPVTPPKQVLPPKRKKPRGPLPVRTIILGVVGVVVLVLASVAFLARETGPEDALYPAKIEIYERALRYTNITPSMRASYATSRIESRLRELQKLANDSSTSSPETIQKVGALIASHAQDVTRAVNDGEVAYELRLNELSKASAVSKAAADLSKDYPELESAYDAMDSGREEIAKLQTATIDTFASSSATSTLEAYLSAHLSIVSDGLGKVAQGSSAQRIAIARIQDANEAISEGRLGFAIRAILRAEEALEVDRLLYAAERGDGPLPENTLPATTEGQ